MRAKVAGTGRYEPPHVYGNEFMHEFVGAPASWLPEVIGRRLGITERRFSVPLEIKTGKPEHFTDEMDIAAEAALKAMDAAQKEPSEVDMLILVSCTAQRGARKHFSRSAFDLHLKLGLSGKAMVLEMDAGCGGAVHALEIASMCIESGRKKGILVVASSCPSQYMDRTYYQAHGAWLSPLIFGDGAGAAMLVPSEDGAGIIKTVTLVDPGMPLMNMKGDPEKDPDLAYWIDAKGVKLGFGMYAARALALLKEGMHTALEARRYIFHQVNGNILRSFVEKEGLESEKVPIHVFRRGNIAAAATLDILDEQIRLRALVQGDTAVICAVGAGAQAGALALQL